MQRHFRNSMAGLAPAESVGIHDNSNSSNNHNNNDNIMIIVTTIAIIIVGTIMIVDNT